MDFDELDGLLEDEAFFPDPGGTVFGADVPAGTPGPENPRQHYLHQFSEDTKEFLRNADLTVVEKYFGPTAVVADPDQTVGSGMGAFLSIAESALVLEKIRRPLSRESAEGGVTVFSEGGEDRMLHFEARASFLQTSYGVELPEPIWTCCKSKCFAKLAMQKDSEPFLVEIRRICREARKLYDKSKSTIFVNARRRGIGGTAPFHANHTRSQRTTQQNIDDPDCTDRINAALQFREFCEKNIPFLRGLQHSEHGISKLPKRLCMQAIKCVLGCSLNFMYHRRRIDANEIRNSGQDLLQSLLDSSGLRERQYRRTGSRDGFPEIAELPKFQCGCDFPCWENHETATLKRLYDQFVQTSCQVGSQRKEHQYLLNVMWSPLTNSVDQTCDTALSALYTVTPWLISKVRSVVQRMCRDPTIEQLEPDAHGMKIYRQKHHPMNKLPHAIRIRVEQELDIVTRADPEAADNVVTIRVYNPEVNTHEKLARMILDGIGEHDEITVHPSTIRRIVHEYLREKGFRLSFSNSDHNACPVCKYMTNACFRFHNAKKCIQRNLSEEQMEADVRLSLQNDLSVSEFQEKETFHEFEIHRNRHFHIRRWLNRCITQFKMIENKYREAEHAVISEDHFPDLSTAWRSRRCHALITHSDESTKFNLPSSVVEVSCDITRFRFDLNANCNPVTDMANVFSNEQGTSGKTSSSIIQTILTDHLLSCRGEGVKIVLMDCASVGRNWTTTVCLPQYMVDQGLADVVLIVFFENCHGKYLSDQLFGQVQRRKKRSTILGIDALLSEFEKVKKKGGGCVSGFATNPLSGIDFSAVFSSLGYETTPHPDLRFNRRNIHFAAACRAGAPAALSPAVYDLIYPLLPSDEGMVRLTSEPPGARPNAALPFENRYVDVPASKENAYPIPLQKENPPLVVPLKQPFSPSGDCVVSTRTTEHVGYNGLRFRKRKGFSELSGHSSKIVQEAWPPDLIGQDADYGVGIPPGVKCAPNNWIVRRPVSQFSSSASRFVARYPPRNLLNATIERGPREEQGWVPVQTYPEPPFPLIVSTSAYNAARNLSEKFTNIKESIHFLDILHSVFCEMDSDRDALADPWSHYPVTRCAPASRARYKEILRLSKSRLKGHPKPPRSVNIFFKHNEIVKERVRRIANETHETQRDVFKRLYKEQKNVPGGLELYEKLAEDDEKRYARELSLFLNTVQKSFDEENGIAPIV